MDDACYPEWEEREDWKKSVIWVNREKGGVVGCSELCKKKQSRRQEQIMCDDKRCEQRCTVHGLKYRKVARTNQWKTGCAEHVKAGKRI